MLSNILFLINLSQHNWNMYADIDQEICEFIRQGYGGTFKML